jgi:hypothetical protein
MIIKNFSCFSLFFSLVTMTALCSGWSHDLTIHNQSTLSDSKLKATVFPSIGGVSQKVLVLDNDQVGTLSFTESSSYFGCPWGMLGFHCNKGEINFEFWQGGNILTYSNCTVKYLGEPQGPQFETFETTKDILGSCRHFNLSHRCTSGYNCIDVID